MGMCVNMLPCWKDMWIFSQRWNVSDQNFLQKKCRSECSFFKSIDFMEIHLFEDMAMNQYLYIPFLVGWTSIYQLFFMFTRGTRFWPTAIYLFDQTLIGDTLVWSDKFIPLALWHIDSTEIHLADPENENTLFLCCIIHAGDRAKYRKLLTYSAMPIVKANGISIRTQFAMEIPIGKSSPFVTSPIPKFPSSSTSLGWSDMAPGMPQGAMTTPLLYYSKSRGIDGDHWPVELFQFLEENSLFLSYKFTKHHPLAASLMAQMTDVGASSGETSWDLVIQNSDLPSPTSPSHFEKQITMKIVGLADSSAWSDMKLRTPKRWWKLHSHGSEYPKFAGWFISWKILLYMDDLGVAPWLRKPPDGFVHIFFVIYWWCLSFVNVHQRVPKWWGVAFFYIFFCGVEWD